MLLSDPLTKEELQAWKGSPLTVKVLTWLHHRRELVNSNPVYFPESMEKTALTTAYQAGMVRAYDELLNLEAEKGNEG